MQYAAPAICLLAGSGAARALQWLPARSRLGTTPARRLAMARSLLPRRGSSRWCSTCGTRIARPRRDVPRLRPPVLARGPPRAPTSLTSAGTWASPRGTRSAWASPSPSATRRSTPHPAAGRGPARPRARQAGPSDAPLRGHAQDEPKLVAWLDRIGSTHTLARREDRIANMAEPGATPRPERYVILDLFPGPDSRDAAGSPFDIDPGDGRLARGMRGTSEVRPEYERPETSPVQLSPNGPFCLDTRLSSISHSSQWRTRSRYQTDPNVKLAVFKGKSGGEGKATPKRTQMPNWQASIEDPWAVPRKFIPSRKRPCHPGSGPNSSRRADPESAPGVRRGRGYPDPVNLGDRPRPGR